MDTHQQTLFNKIQAYSIYALILLLPFTHKEAYSIYNPDLVWSKFVLAFCALGGLIVFVKNYKFYLKNIYFKLLLVYLGFQILSLARTQDFYNSILFIGFFTSIVFLFVFVYDYLIKNKVTSILKFYVGALTFTILFLFWQKYSLENLNMKTGGVWPVPGYPTRYGSTFWDVNHYGVYLSSLLLLFLGYLLNQAKFKAIKGSLFDKLTPVRARILLLVLSLKNFRPKLSEHKLDKKTLIGFTVLFLLTIYAFRMTGSRSSLLGLLAGGSFFLVGYFFLRKKLSEVFVHYKSLTFLSLLSLLPIIFLIMFREDVRDAFLYRAVSFYAHLFLLKVGILTGLQNFFLGIGVNAFSEYFKTSIWAESYYYIDRAALNLKLPLHNLWLEAWVETGVFAFAFFALLWGILLTDLYKIYKTNKDYIALGLGSGIVVFLVGGLFYSYKSEFFWFFAIVAFAYASVKRELHLNFNFHLLKSYKPWMGLIAALALIFPLLFFTMPIASTEIFHFYYYFENNTLFDIWIMFLNNFRYVIGNYSFTGRFLMLLLYISAVFSTLSILRKFNTSFFTSFLLAAFFFLTLNYKYQTIIVSFVTFNIYLFLILSNLILVLFPIKRRIPCEIKIWNYMLSIAVIIMLPFSILSSVKFYENTYNTNLNFLIELAANRSKTNDALIFVEEESWGQLVRYYADRLEDDSEGRFYLVDSTVASLSLFKCDQWIFQPGVKYLFLTTSDFNCSSLQEGSPHVNVVEQGNYKLVMYEEKIRIQEE